MKKFDLGNLDEVRAFVDSWTHPVSALLLNAGLSTGKFEYINGIEKAFAVNHLGGAALFFGLHAKGLLTPDARIIFTSSGMHDPKLPNNMGVPIYKSTAEVATGEDAKAKGNTNIQYSNTKLANVLFSYAISRRAEENPATKGWTVIAMDPAFIPGGGSKFFRDQGKLAECAASVMSYIPGFIQWASGITVSTTPRSGKALAELATGDRHKGEKNVYYQIENVKESSEQSHDIKMQDDLWDWTVKKLGASPKL